MEQTFSVDLEVEDTYATKCERKQPLTLLITQMQDAEQTVTSGSHRLKVRPHQREKQRY